MTAQLRVALALLLGATAAGAEEQPVVLEHDPFARPAALADAGSGGGARAPAASVGSTQLRATVVDGSESMANVGGVIVKMGEELNGYRLIEVGERQAVFEREGTRRVLHMD